MAIAFCGDSSAGSSTASVAVSRPAGVVYGDVLLAFLVGSDPAITPTFTTPSGWTSLATDTVEGRAHAVYWRRAGASEPTSYTFAHDGDDAVSATAGYVVAYSGCVYSGDPVDAYSNTAYITSDKDVVAAEVTTTVANAVLVYLGTASGSGVGAGTIAGMTEREDAAWNGDRRILVADAVQASAGASGAKTATLTADANFTNKHAFLVALSPSVNPPVASLVAPTDGGIAQGLSPTFTFGTSNPDSADLHIVLKVSAFSDFRTLAIDKDSNTDYADWEEAASPFSSWSAVGSGGATAGNRLRYAASEVLRYDNYYGLVWIEDASHTGLAVLFDFSVSPDATAALAVTLGGTAFYPVNGTCRITEETGGEASVIGFDINLAQYLAHPLTKGDAITVASGIGGHARTWNGTVESWTFDGSVVHVHGLQDDAYLSRKVCTGDEASADLGQNLADFVTSYGTPLTGTNIATSTGVTMGLTGGYKYLREHFSDAVKVLPEYILWADSTGDLHFVSQDSLPIPACELYEEDPSA